MLVEVPIPILPLALTYNDVAPPNVSTSKTPPVEPLTCNLAVGLVVPIPIDEPDSKIGVAVFAIVVLLLNLTI